MEATHLVAAGYQPAVDGPFYAPMSKSNFTVPGAHPDGTGPILYRHYKEAVLFFVAGDFGASECFNTLSDLRQKGRDIREHVEEWRQLLELYLKLQKTDSPEAVKRMSLFSSLFYKSLDTEIKSALRDFPDDLEQAYESAQSANKTLKKRRSFGAEPTSSPSTQHERPPGLSRAPLRAQGQGHYVHPNRALNFMAASSGHAHDAHDDADRYEVNNLASYLDTNDTNGVKFIVSVCQVCNLQPDHNAVVSSKAYEHDALRAGVRSALSTSRSRVQALHAIKNLVPSKYTLQTSTSRHETSEYDNLDDITMSV
jgi:hypothetical protein